MDTNEITVIKQCIQIRQFYAKLCRTDRIRIRIIGQDSRSESRKFFCQKPCDRSKSNQADHGVREGLERSQILVTAAASTEQVLRQRQIPRNSKQEHCCMRGDFIKAVIRHVADHDARLICCNKVNIIHADGIANDDPAARKVRDHLLCNRCKLNDKRVAVCCPCKEFLLR